MEDHIQWIPFRGRYFFLFFFIKNDLWWKTTFNGDHNLMENTMDRRHPWMEDYLPWKTTYRKLFHIYVAQAFFNHIHSYLNHWTQLGGENYSYGCNPYYKIQNLRMDLSFEEKKTICKSVKCFTSYSNPRDTGGFMHFFKNPVEGVITILSLWNE